MLQLSVSKRRPLYVIAVAAVIRREGKLLATRLALTKDAGSLRNALLEPHKVIKLP